MAHGFTEVFLELRQRFSRSYFDAKVFAFAPPFSIPVLHRQPVLLHVFLLPWSPVSLDWLMSVVAELVVRSIPFSDGSGDCRLVDVER
jgi:hypothetical protein